MVEGPGPLPPNLPGPPRRSRGETVLIATTSVAALVMLVLSAGLWLRFGETVFTARVLSLLEYCL